MKEESGQWLIQARKDLDTANYLFDGKKYEASALYCQQAVEKVLKTVLIKRSGKFPKIHDLVALGKEVKINHLFLDNFKELTMAYNYSRYPDVPQQSLLKEKTSRFLKVTKEVLVWTEKEISKKN